MATKTAARLPVSVEASEFMSALGTVVQWIKRTPLPLDAAELRGLQPKPRHISALLQVARDERLSVSDLADRQHVSLGTASQLVSDLAELGLVQRIEDPTDRRRTLVEVSAEHRALVDSVLDGRVRPLEEALQRLSADERKGLCVGLGRLASELSPHDTERTS